MIVGLSTHPGERRHDDAIRKIEVSHPIWREKRLIRHHMNSCIGEMVMNHSVRYDAEGMARMQRY
jgi:hypothetical protein